MSRRPGASPGPDAAARPSQDEAVKREPAETGAEIVGLVAGEGGRSGEDARRRGWFWHWNSLVTQYAPLVGLKGVGLLNSYTVWTDRRDESPTRGYAFPTQQSEADFYGEDRAELMTINKILVALDLIEIRKEMVLRADGQGRRWRVPHNFYRVKDHGDGYTLNSADVLRVADLADRDPAVYRYVRRAFSPKFTPIDRDNVWVGILAEVGRSELWQRLTARAAQEEHRASARSKAGHAARKPAFILPEAGDTAASGDMGVDSATVGREKGRATNAASTNIGSEVDAGSINIGLEPDPATSVGHANRARRTRVDQTSSTYDQFPLSTTTTSGDGDVDEEKNVSQPVGGLGQRSVTSRFAAVTEAVPSGPGARSAPADGPGEAAALLAFAEANGREPTAAERRLLRELADRFDAPARAADGGRAELGSGWAWIAASVYDAVDAGSAFVAPRRIREILIRWEREGLPQNVDRTATVVAVEPTEPTRRPAARGKALPGQPAPVAETRRPEPAARSETGTVGPSASGNRAPEPVELGSGPEVAMPHGHGSRRTWEFAVGLLGAAIGRERLRDLVGGSAIVACRDGEVTIAVPTPAQADQLLGEYRDLVTRKLGEAMRRPVRIAVLLAAPVEDAAPVETAASSAPTFRPTAPAPFIVAECGMPNAQVWAAVIDELASGGAVSRGDIETWIRPTQLIGRNAAGGFVVGAPHRLAQRRIAGRLLPELRDALARITGALLPLQIVVIDEWPGADREDSARAG